MRGFGGYDWMDGVDMGSTGERVKTIDESLVSEVTKVVGVALLKKQLKENSPVTPAFKLGDKNPPVLGALALKRLSKYNPLKKPKGCGKYAIPIDWITVILLHVINKALDTCCMGNQGKKATTGQLPRSRM